MLQSTRRRTICTLLVMESTQNLAQCDVLLHLENSVLEPQSTGLNSDPRLVPKQDAPTMKFKFGMLSFNSAPLRTK